MSKIKVRWIAILGTLAIISIIIVQAFWVYQLYTFREFEFDQKVKVALFKTAQHLADLNNSVLPKTRIINQVSSNYFVVNINDHIKADHLEYFLQKELQQSLIDEDFEYGIYDCSNDQMVYGNYIRSNTDPLPEPQFKSKLPTHDAFTYYFGVFFPKKNVTIVDNMRLVFYISILLGAAIAIYIYSIFTIVKQNELSELQKDFINNMTHEFKTPLASIKLATNAISNDEKVINDSRLSKLSDIIDQQNKRLNGHVERILQLANIERNKFLMDKTEVDLNEVVRELIPAIKLRIDELGGSLQVELPDNPIIILADRLHLCNILDNLVDNAIKYSVEAPQVFLKNVVKNKSVQVIITDRGVGMDDSTLKKIFKKFYRHHTGNVHDVKGFGLGLFYVKNICKAHHWLLKIYSKPKEGTKVIITMPIL